MPGMEMTPINRLRILTFNSHQAYVFNLAKVGGRLDIIHQAEGDGCMHWNWRIRPLPENAALVSLEKAKQRLRENRYDLAVCHNISDLMAIKENRIPKILCIHGTVKARIVTERSWLSRDQWNRMVAAYLDLHEDVHVVFVSEKKRRDSGLPGTVILSGVDSAEYCGYNGAIPSALTVANRFVMRRDILGYDRYRKIVRSVPCRIVGENPGLPDAFTASDWEALKENYRNHRAYVYTALSEYEDGYNLAMLEAMATGMPVVSIENDTSPIIDGVNGYISDDERVLEKRLKQLLLDREKAAAMGTAARQTVSNLFGIHRFIQNWRRLIAGIIPNQEVTYEGELAIQRT